MDENKEKLSGLSPEDTESIQDEMEELAKVFKEELDKAKSEAESLSEGLENLQIEGYNPQKVTFGEKPKAFTEKKLCEYCGERPAGTDKDPDSSYCSECEHTLEEYPYDYKGVIAAIVTVCIAVAAIFCFALNVPIFSAMKQGDKAVNEGRLYSAMNKYDEAVRLAENSGSEKTYINLYAKRAITNFSMVNMNSAVTEIDENIPDFVLKLLTFKKLDNILDETERMQASAIIAQQHIANYPDVTEENYGDMIADLDNLSGKKIYIKGTEYHDETEKDFTPDGTETVYICDDGWLNMYKYAAAQELKKDPEIIAGFLQACADSSEYMKTLVGSLLASTYAGMGEYDKAKTIADELKAINNESAEWYMVESLLYRYRDNDYEKALNTCDAGLKMLSELPDGKNFVMRYGYMLQIQQALNYVMQDENDLAYQAVTEAYDNLSLTNGLTIPVRDLYAMLAHATGDKEAFEALELEIDAFGEEAYAFSKDVTDYTSGKVTLKEIAESGRYDII